LAQQYSSLSHSIIYKVLTWICSFMQSRIRKKCCAVLLLLLLVGHEARRLNRYTGKIEATPVSLSRVESEGCSWSLRGGCIGEGCMFRPLALDKSFSDSCRLSDDYMLSNDTMLKKFATNEAQILSDKSETFEGECLAAKSTVWKWFRKRRTHCLRRMQQIIKATKFLGRATGSIEKMNSSELADKVNASLADSLDSMATAFGEDKKYVQTLVSKLRTNAVGISKDPQSVLKMFGNSIVVLGGRDEAKKAIVRREIDELPATKRELTSEDVDDIRNATEEFVKMAQSDEAGQEEENALNTVDLIADATSRQDSATVGSLLQVLHSKTDPKKDRLSKGDPKQGDEANVDVVKKKRSLFYRIMTLPLKVNPMVLAIIGMVFSLVFMIFLWPSLIELAFVQVTGHIAKGFLAGVFKFILGIIMSSFINSVFTRWGNAAKKFQGVATDEEKREQKRQAAIDAWSPLDDKDSLEDDMFSKDFRADDVAQLKRKASHTRLKAVYGDAYATGAAQYVGTASKRSRGSRES